MIESRYADGDYARQNPTWHSEDSPWKANQIVQLIDQNKLSLRTICEVGCGAGEVLRQLQLSLSPECEFWGYELSPDAFELCRGKANARLHFKLADVVTEQVSFDLLLLIDVVEHVPDYIGFLRAVRGKGRYKVIHIPLDISVQSVLRAAPILKSRTEVGHLHYFTKETALGTLKDCGYEILDWFFTAGTVDLPAQSLKSWAAKLPRKVMFALHRELAVRLLGGFSLLVLAR